ncbi:MAG TPA: DUF2017 family protein [Gaiellaceae bacterium]
MFQGHGIERTAEGDFRLSLPQPERELLRHLRAELEQLLDAAPEDPSLRRLFPPAYDDEADETEYRRLMRDELLGGRRRALRVLEETAGHDRLSADEAQAWLTALNDLRLVLGTRLEVSEETLLDGLDPDDPRAPELALYAYLSWLQEQLVEAIGST